MPSCCDQPLDPAPAVNLGELTIALAGNPNCGKTTIFNALTGLRQKVANYPGVTVEKKTGRAKLPGGRWVSVIDLPGTYSLISRSPDEQVAMEVLRGVRADTRTPDVVVVVVDASNLQRNLYLVSQLIELGRPLVVALNMMDVAERRGLHVDPTLLSKKLGVPVVPLVGHKRTGVDDLKAAIANARVAPLPEWPLPEAMQEEVTVVGGGLAILGESASPQPSLDRYRAMAERLLIGDSAGDLAEVAARAPVAALLRAAASRLGTLGIDPMQSDIEAHYKWIESVAAEATAPVEELAAMGVSAAGGSLPYATPRTRTFSEQLDSIFIHKIWGLLIFAAIMGTLFVTIFWLAAPIMDGIKAGVDWLGQHLTNRLGEGPIKDLLKDGIFAGVGAVVVFVPQIALLFLFLSILEDSGYLARAAFLMDRLLAKVGLHGKSFIPLLSSFACAIPGIMATRTIENRRDRLATILIAPFMSCSARLPVYTLLIGAFFARGGPVLQAGIMLGLYALGIVAAAVTAWVFKRSFLKGAPAAFILELPTYKMPQLSQVGRHVWSNTREFLAKAGTTIFCLSIVLWAVAYYPRMPHARVEAAEARGREAAAEDYRQRLIQGGDGEKPGDEKPFVENAVAAAQSEYSIAGHVGHFMEPAIKPLGYDWKMGVGLVSAFAAREVFVSAMGIVYAVGDVEKGGTADLQSQIARDYTPLTGLSLLIWFVLAMQCMSTLAIVRRETGGWRWPLFMVLYMNGLAYVVCLSVFQVGRLLSHA